MRLLSVLAAILCFSFLDRPCATAAITWNVTFQDVVASSGLGFDDSTEGATRQATFISALNYVSSILDATATLDFVVRQSETDGEGFLASASTYYFTGPNGFSNGLLFQHATTGSDPVGGLEDGFATFDFGHEWNSGLGVTASNESDLFTVSLHEITHTLGFASLVKPNGTSEISDGDPGVFSNLDSFLERGDGSPLFAAGGDFVGDVADLTSDDLFFTGANATAANGGNPVKMYAPGVFEGGSSVSHVDTDTFPTAVMTHSLESGVEKRAFTAIDLGILQDIGWSLNATAVPEPGSFIGIALVCVAGFARRKGRASFATTTA